MRGEGIANRGLIIASVVFILIVGAIFFAISGGIFNAQPLPEQISVTDTGNGRSIRMTVEGPIVANEDRESYRIEISNSNRSISALGGYDGQVKNSKEYTNSVRAFSELVFALEKAGFDERRQVTGSQAEERGSCATGRQYIFEILQDGRQVSRAWTTSCGSASGTLATEVGTVKSLFDKQIPDRREVLGSFNL